MLSLCLLQWQQVPSGRFLDHHRSNPYATRESKFLITALITAHVAVGCGDASALEKLWQGCGKNPDFTAKTDITDILPVEQNQQLACFQYTTVASGLQAHPP